MTVHLRSKAEDLIQTLKVFRDWSDYSQWVNLMS